VINFTLSKTTSNRKHQKMNAHAPIDTVQHTGAANADYHVTEMPTDFAMLPDGIYFCPPGDTADPVRVCSPLRVDAKFRLTGNKGWGLLVWVRAPDETWHKVLITNRLLTVKPTEVLGTLIDHGLDLAPGSKSKDHLFTLLLCWKPTKQIVAVPHGGWADASYTSFILGSTVIGPGQFEPLTAAHGPGRSLGAVDSAEAWKAALGSRCSGNPLMVLAVSLAFSGPLLEPMGMSGGGLHFRGVSSSGKTTLLNLAASVWGGRDLITQWRATANGLEAVASMLNGVLLPLDEIAEISGRELHSVVYMLANGTGKNRMTKDALLADTARWRLALISSGEISIAQKLKDARLDVMAGHEVRLIDVEADGRLYGAFDDLHGAPDAATFANTVLRKSQSHYGTVGAKFVEYLVQLLAAGKAEAIQKNVRRLTAVWLGKLPSASDGQIERVAARFALIATAGIIATKHGLTGWKTNEPTEAAEMAFFEWYERSYSAKREAVDRFVSPLREFLAANLSSFPLVGSPLTKSAMPVGLRTTTLAYFPPETWAKIFPGTDLTTAAKALIEMGLLKEGDGGRTTCKTPHSVPGRPRHYAVDIPKLDAYRSE